jgi:hypothetical protein
MRRWLGAGCALAVVCACASLRSALGQTSANTTQAASSAKTKARSSSTRTNSATPKPKASAKSSRAGSSSAGKTHAASHPAAGAHSKSSTAAAAHSSKSKYASTRKSGKRKTTARGQQKIDPERAQAIQEALIRAHYLSGEVAGKWDQASEEAMRRYQADHGWQSKTVPDSRALISLGLGPSHDHLLNPESAMTTEPAAPRSETSIPASHSADPGARVTTTPPVAPAPATPPAHNSSNPQ